MIKEMSFYDSTRFKALQKKWYSRLKKSGFEDIEEIRNGTELLKSWDSLRFLKPSRQLTAGIIESTQSYYTKAEHLVGSGKFQSEQEKQIWKQHSTGQGIRQIAKELKVKTWLVHQTIKSLQKRFKLRKS